MVFGLGSLALTRRCSPSAHAVRGRPAASSLRPDATAQNALANRDRPPTIIPGSPAAKTQEEQNNAFRLEGPIVKWTARTLNVSTETAARIFEFTNFAVILLLVGIPILHASLPKVFHRSGPGDARREPETSARSR